LTYLDILSRKSKRSRGGGSDSDSDDGPPPDPDEVAPAAPVKKEKKASGEAKEVQVTARKAEDGPGGQASLSAVRREMLHIIRSEEDEKWELLDFCDVAVRFCRSSCFSLSHLPVRPITLQTPSKEYFHKVTRF